MNHMKQNCGHRSMKVHRCKQIKAMDTKMLGKQVLRSEPDSSGSGQGPAAGYYKHSGSIKGGIF
jgi:hypothetical protein